MNEIIEFSKIQERRRAEKIAADCKTINKFIIIMFFVISGLCAAHIIPESNMYAYIISGGAGLTISTICLEIQDMKISRNSYDEEEEEDE